MILAPLGHEALAGLPREVRHAEEIAMLWAIVAVLVVLWLLGFTVFHLGAIIHLVLVVALIVLVYQIVTGRRSL